MNRLIYKDLIAWQRSPIRKPLIMRGARQVGKTYSIRRFGKANFKNFVEVNLEKNRELHSLFKENLSAIRIKNDLEVLLNTKITETETLLFLDEIQACPEAITALRYFYEEIPGLHVIAAGSLLEFTLSRISIPVGRVQFLTLQPLSFGEFLYATGKKEAARIVLEPPHPISPPIHEMLLKEVYRYFLVGGLPACVGSIEQAESLRNAIASQEAIIETYRMDFAKYTPFVDVQCLDTVLLSAAQKVGQQVKYNTLAEDFSVPTIKKALYALFKSRLCQQIRSADPSGLPLGASASSKIFKVILVDIGLLRALANLPKTVETVNADLLALFRGAMAEQFVGQELTLSQNEPLHYWARKEGSSAAEVDYLAVVDGSIYPVEVKSGPAGRLRSIQSFFTKYPSTHDALVFSTRPFEALPVQRLRFIPLYWAYSATGGNSTFEDLEKSL
jgi:uncharacterized protein